MVDTTWLDRIGIPVFASIRPTASKKSLCVNAGKGFTSAEAKIGAYMEAIEFSYAEEGRNCVPWFMAKPTDILESFQGRISFPEFCAEMGQEVSEDSDIAVCRAHEIMSGLGDVLVPAELVYAPFSNNPGVQPYCTTTNGLASGNTVEEATVHGLAEVMERHVHSFQLIKDESVLVRPEGLTPKLQLMFDRIQAAGLSVHLRYRQNKFGMAFCSAYVMEPDERNPIPIAGGHGFHPLREIAAIRAVAEAVQSRLTNIHGGRDDLMRHVKNEGALSGGSPEALHREIKARQKEIADATGAISYEDMPDTQVHDLNDALHALYAGLRKEEIHHVARVVLTEPECPFQVVRIVAPGAENFSHEVKRVGPRLLEHFTND